MSGVNIPELAVPFFFRSRPASLPPDLRPAWRISAIILLLRKCCRDNRSSYARLHVLNWAVCAPSSQKQLLQILTGIADPDVVTVRIDPALNYAVDLAKGEGLVELSAGSHVQLKGRGISLADDLYDTGGILTAEKKFMAAVGKKVTEALVSRLLKVDRGT